MNRSTRVLAAVAALLSLPLLPGTVLAEALMVKTQAPGWHRSMLGDFEVTALFDGAGKLPMLKLLVNAPPKQLAAALKRGFLNEVEETSINAYLINTGSKLVLIDTGTGGMFGFPPALQNNLRAAGYKSEQVDEVYITHAHPDHLAGLMADGALAFPNATVRIAKADADVFLNQEAMNRAPAEGQMAFKASMASLNPYLAAGRLKTFEGATELVPGVHAVPAPGHSPGHTMYRIESKGDTLLLWGDLVHSAAVQFDNPGVGMVWDADGKNAVEQRKRVLAEVAKKGWMVGASHVSFPGLGHLRATPGGKGYTWVPLNYSTLK